jgi:ribonucleotide reductase beta subunit family protein with ferritin-like domain
MSLVDELKAESGKIIDPDIKAYIDKVNINDEPLLSDDPERFMLVTPKSSPIYDLYLLCEKSFWVADEHSMADDARDFTRMNGPMKMLLLMVLAFFANSDGIIVENIANRFLMEIKNAASRCFYGFQIMIENVHSRAYGIMLSSLIKGSELEELTHAIYKPGAIRNKAVWLFKYMSNPDPSHYIRSAASLDVRLIAYACGEMILFSTSFLVIFWFKSMGLCPGICYFNELIQRDENMHGQGSILHHHRWNQKVPEELAHRIIKEAVELECAFFKEILPEGLVGLNYDDVVIYVKFLANNISVSLGYSAIYENVRQPFPFMEKQSSNIKANMHEKQITQYEIATSKNAKDNEVNLDELF